MDWIQGLALGWWVGSGLGAWSHSNNVSVMVARRRGRIPRFRDYLWGTLRFLPLFLLCGPLGLLWASMLHEHADRTTAR